MDATRQFDNRICAKANAELDILLEESEIDRILRSEDQDAAPEVIALAEREAQEFINDLLSGLRERMLELKSGKVIFRGRGATLLRRQIEASGKIGQAIFVEDINANAKGYEYLYRLQHRRAVSAMTDKNGPREIHDSLQHL